MKDIALFRGGLPPTLQLRLDGALVRRLQPDKSGV